MTSQQHLLARDVINVIMKSPEELLKEMEEKRIRFRRNIIFFSILNLLRHFVNYTFNHK